jgi:hypothetical protein
MKREQCGTSIRKGIPPDPLEVLEKWRDHTKYNVDPHDKSDWCELWFEESSIIKELRTNPDAVIARGKEEGWLK